MVELAYFRPDDDPCLVAASLACPTCLSGSVEWWVRAHEPEAQALCRCHACGHERAVELTGLQELRLCIDRERVEQAAA